MRVPPRRLISLTTVVCLLAVGGFAAVAPRPAVAATTLSMPSHVAAFQAACATGGSGATGADAIACINQQRAVNGIPPYTSDVQAMASTWCPDEANFSAAAGTGAMSANSAAPAAQWSVEGSPWGSGANGAPFHQAGIYNPWWTAAGEVTSGDTACFAAGTPMQTWSTPTFFAFESPSGPSAVPYAEQVAEELPFAPQNVVGIAEGVETGPDIILYAVGFPEEGTYGSNSVQPVAWSLSTATGAEVPDVLMVDQSNTAAYKQDIVEDDNAFLIPREPLAPGTTYDGTVTWQGPDGTTATQTFSFATTPQPNPIRLSVSPGARRTTIGVSGTAPATHVTLTGPRTISRTLPASTGTIVLRLPVGSWRVCASSGGGATGYASASTCRDFIVFVLRLTGRTTSSASLLASSAILDRRARLTFAYQRRGCWPLGEGHRQCGLEDFAISRSTIALRARQSLPFSTRWLRTARRVEATVALRRSMVGTVAIPADYTHRGFAVSGRR
jgi:hypothetical protein